MPSEEKEIIKTNPEDTETAIPDKDDATQQKSLISTSELRSYLQGEIFTNRKNNPFEARQI